MNILYKIRELQEDLEDELKALQKLPPTQENLEKIKKVQEELLKYTGR